MYTYMYIVHNNTCIHLPGTKKKQLKVAEDRVNGNAAGNLKGM